MKTRGFDGANTDNASSLKFEIQLIQQQKDDLENENKDLRNQIDNLK